MRRAWLERPFRLLPLPNTPPSIRVSRLGTPRFILLFTTLRYQRRTRLDDSSLRQRPLRQSISSTFAINRILCQRFGNGIFSIHHCNGMWVGKGAMPRSFTDVLPTSCSSACFVYPVKVYLRNSHSISAGQSCLFLTLINIHGGDHGKQCIRVSRKEKRRV